MSNLIPIGGGMALRENVRKTYTLLNENKNLMRLLHYFSETTDKNPLDSSLKEVEDLPNYEEILNNVIILGDKTDDLSLDTTMARLCVFSGGRVAYKGYSNTTGLMGGNPYVSKQMYIIDAYCSISSHRVDARLDWLGEEINNSLNDRDYDQYTKLIFREALPIFNSPTSYMGYRWIYELVMTQEENRSYER